MKTMRDIMEAVISELNSPNYKTINQLAKEWGYEGHAFLSKKAKKLNIGLRVRHLLLLSIQDQEILKNSINHKKKIEK